MPGLSFLAKKKWHTSNIKNVEKVWVAEQKDEQERKRLAEFQKQLLEERQIQELRQLQAAQGQVIKHTDNSLDWMYEGPGGGSQVQKDSEEYLLGKIYKPQQTKTFEVGAAPVATQGSSSSNSWVSKVANKNDIFSRKHEDPMIAIKQAEKAQRDKIVNNPLQMERIRQNVAKHLEETEYEKDREARARMELRERMEREMKRNDMDDNDSDDDRSHRKDRKHKKKHHKKDKKKSKKERRRHSDSESSDESDEDRHESSRRSKRSRSRSRDPHETREIDEKRPRYSDALESQRAIARPVAESGASVKNEDKPRTDTENDRGHQRRDRDDDGKDQDRRDRDIDDHRRRSPDRHYRESDRNDRGSRRDSRDRSDYHHRRADSRDRESRYRRDNSRDRHDHHRRDRSPDRRRDSRERDRGRPRSSSRSRNHVSSDNKRSDSSRDDNRLDEFGRSRQRDDDRHQKPSTVEKSSSREDSNTSNLAERKSWGLVFKGGNSGSSNSAGEGLGPSAELLKRKEEEKLKEEQQRQENLRRARGGGNGRNALSEEERLARLRAMQQDAEVVDVTRVVRNKAESTDDNRAHDAAQVHAGKSAEFIHDMRSEVLRTAGESMSVKDRLDTHRHYVQKGAALDDSNTSNFLRR